jgi:RNA-splicing ligase RtcB
MPALICGVDPAEAHSQREFRQHLPWRPARAESRQSQASRRRPQHCRELEEKGIIIRGQSRRTVDEEISEASKDVSNVVDACALAGISRKVAQLRPVGCIKG